MEKLEAIKKARAIEYNFTIHNWDTVTPLRDPMQDIDSLIAKLTKVENALETLLNYIESHEAKIAGYAELYVVRHDKKTIERYRQVLQREEGKPGG